MKSQSLDSKFSECKEYKDRGKYKEIERDNYVILSSKISLGSNEKLNIQTKYYIIVEIPNYVNAFSIYHTANPTIAKKYFDYFVPILNPVLTCKFSTRSMIILLKKVTRYPEYIIENEWTLLHVYAKFNISEIFDFIKQTKQINKSKTEIKNRLIFDLNNNLNKQTKKRKLTVLHMSIRKKNFKFVDKLLQCVPQSIDLTLKDWRGNNAFHHALLAENRNKEFLRLLINYCTNKDQLIEALKSKNVRKCTALHIACYSHKLDCIKILLKIQLPIECFVITSDYMKNESSPSDSILSKRSVLDSSSSICNSSASIASNADEDTIADDESNAQNKKFNSTGIGSNQVNTKTQSKNFQTETSSVSSSSKLNLIQFNNQQINNFVPEEMFKGGTPLHWCSDKRFVGDLLQMGFINYINVRNINDETALHIAVKRNSYRFIVVLFCSGEKVDQTGDCIGNTPLHLAVIEGNLSLVKLLTVFGNEESLNSKNNLGSTPRHLAAQNPSDIHGQILNALHLLGAKRCDEFSAPVIQHNQTFVNSDTSKNDENMNKTMRCNKGCSKTGDYDGKIIYDFEAHEEECWYSNFVLKRIIKNIRNEKLKKKSSKKSIDLGKTSSKTSVIKNCLSLIKLKSKEKDDKKFKSISPINDNNLKRKTNSFLNLKDKIKVKFKEQPDQKRKKNKVLCIDGGGVKGIFVVQILIELEKRLKHPINDYFNWYAGTSTGSFIATLISLNFKLTDIRTLYFVIKNKVFKSSTPYDDEVMESYLKKYLGDRTMSSVINCKLTITSSLYDRLPVQLHLFRNYPSPNELLNKPLPKARQDDKDHTYSELPNYKEQILWKALRASSAAPFYFNAFGSFCDGGLISNSPVIDIITEHFIYNELYEELDDVENQNQELEFILSLGCGQTNVRINNYKYDFSSYSPVDRLFKLAMNVRPFSLILISELNNTENHKQLRTMAWCKSLNIPYIRISPYLVEKVNLDERDDEKIVDGLWKCKAYFNKKKEMVDDLVDLLESSWEQSAIESRSSKIPKFDLNYKVDFDDSKVTISKEIKQTVPIDEQIYEEVKKQNYDP